MEAAVGAFNAVEGLSLTATQGWRFMICLKLARASQGAHRPDNYVDGAAYCALAGEAAAAAAEEKKLEETPREAWDVIRSIVGWP